MRLAALLIAPLLAGCSQRPDAASSHGESAIPSSVARQQAASGAYLGEFVSGDQRLGEYLRLDGSNSALYDGLRWIRICDLTQTDGAIAFRTAPMFDRVFEFRGTTQRGQLRGRMNGFADSRDLVFRPLDHSAPSTLATHDKTGFYSSLQYVEEAGDNVGAELLVSSIGGERTVTLMMAEGEVASPSIASNIREVADTLRFDFSGMSIAHRATAVFRDSVVDVSLGNDEGAQRLRKTYSVDAFFNQPAVGGCHP